METKPSHSSSGETHHGSNTKSYNLAAAIGGNTRLTTAAAILTSSRGIEHSGVEGGAGAITYDTQSGSTGIDPKPNLRVLRDDC